MNNHDGDTGSYRTYIENRISYMNLIGGTNENEDNNFYFVHMTIRPDIFLMILKD